MQIELFYDRLLAKYSLMEIWDLDNEGKKFSERFAYQKNAGSLTE